MRIALAMKCPRFLRNPTTRFYFPEGDLEPADDGLISASPALD
jgi:hypothetical protein